MLRAIKVLIFVLLAAAVLTTTFGAGYTVAVTGNVPPQVLRTDRDGPRTVVAREAPKQFGILDEVWNILSQDFVEPKALDADKLGKGAVNGLLNALGDSHTSYIDAENFRAEQTGIRGTYEGIGANVVTVDGVITVVAPLPGSPAESAGIRPGDRILAVNGESTQSMSLNDAVNKIKGPRSTKVILSILREGETAPRTIEIVRAEIRTSSVILRMLPEGYAHLRITQFNQRTSSELTGALRDVKNQRARGIILDLRSNPGGLLDVTVEAAGHFLDGGIAGYQVDRFGRKDELKVPGGGQATTIPLVVLINGGSASGSELLAGALQDRGRALLIGSKSFGKGSVNHLRELSDGSALYVTIGRWYTPKGRQIEANGLTPDIEVPLTEEDIRNQRDTQFQRALQALQEQTR
ncbi:MAG: S41 family peptidase [Chloroflexi bacterium]|nr:S41 family peptidase [Chloroflexota bacterium]